MLPSNNKHQGWKGYGSIPGKFWYEVLRGAKKRGLLVNITIQQAWELFIKQDKKCAISGQKLQFNRKMRSHCSVRTASLDRKNSNGNYDINNVQWVHKKINIMKQSMSDKEFLDWCRKICYYQDNKNEYKNENKTNKNLP